MVFKMKKIKLDSFIVMLYILLTIPYICICVLSFPNKKAFLMVFTYVIMPIVLGYVLGKLIKGEQK